MAYRTILVFCLGLLLSGCASQQEADALGEKVGSVFRSLGDAVGSLVASVIRDDSRQSRTAQQTIRAYGYTPGQGLKLVLTQVQVRPKVVAPGGRLVTTFEYVVLGADQDGVTVLESCLLKQNNRVVATLAQKSVKRTDGTWTGVLEFEVPPDAAPGRYLIARQISAGRMAQSKQIDFSVRRGAAGLPAEPAAVAMVEPGRDGLPP